MKWKKSKKTTINKLYQFKKLIWKFHYDFKQVDIIEKDKGTMKKTLRVIKR